MKITYRRELKHNYMIIDPELEMEADGRSYVSRILSSNGIDGILRFHRRQMDGESRFYYEITSRQPMARLLEGQGLRSDQIRSLVLGIARILDRMEQYLLPESCILLEPEYIYVDPEQFQIWLCLVPGLSRNFPEDYGKLLEYLLGKVDHQDKESVVLAYGLYQETRKENYCMDDILRYLGKCRVPAQEEAAGKGLSGKNQRELCQEKTGRKPEDRPLGEELGGRSETKGKPEKVERSSLWKKIREWLRKWTFSPEEEPVQIPWELMFEEKQEEKGQAADQAADQTEPGRLKLDAENPLIFENRWKEEENTFPSSNTVLLTDLSQGAVTQCRCLHSLDGENEDIRISYYPFIIGKQENLVDYVLKRDTVSRLHLRIDREEKQYYVRDLNSTNGTVVAGRLLEANERAVLNEGDEVFIAGNRYRFE